MTTLSKTDNAAEWQPIETAPKDGSEILLLEATCPQPMYRVGYWEERGISIHDDLSELDSELEGEGWSLADEGYIGCISPTHWMPLPAPPELAREQGQ